MAKQRRKTDWEKKHQRNVSRYQRKVEALYEEAAKQAALLGGTVGVLAADTAFSFDSQPALRKRAEKLLSGLYSGVYAAIVDGIKAEWTLANNKNSELSRMVFGDNIGKLTKEQYARYFSTTGDACDAFIRRKVSGLNLSDRVWKYTNQFKGEIETVLDIGIHSGHSADALSQDLREFLKYPDKLFRRVRTGVDEDGNPIYRLSKAAEEFHPGQGVYRSSYKNARRLAATETNIAYRTSDYDRWQDMDFIVGIKICLSNNHTLNGKPFSDICDELKGNYPKDFKFTGWHPHCRCHVETIMKTREELDEDLDRMLRGEEPTQGSVNEVKEVPDNFKKWVGDNGERIARAEEKGTLPYFLRENEKAWKDQPVPQYGNMEGAKLGRAASKEAFKEYENGKPITVPRELLSNLKEAADALGIEITPMTFLEANEGMANVDRGKGVLFAQNCQCCVAVHEARLRGLDITAIGYSPEMESAQFILGESFQKIWIGKNKTTPQVTLLKGESDTEIIGKLEKSTQAIGRYHIGLNYKNGTGHVITAERLASGKIVYYDAQTGNFISIEGYTDLESLEVLKVDKLLFDVEMLKKISRIV